MAELIHIDGLSINGPIIPVTLQPIEEFILQVRKQREGVPDKVKARALIDTGARVSALTYKIVDDLGLKPIGAEYLCTVYPEGMLCNKYFLKLTILNHRVSIEMAFFGVPDMLPEFDCLLGRDFLGDCVFNYKGVDSAFSLDCFHNQPLRIRQRRGTHKG